MHGCGKKEDHGEIAFGCGKHAKYMRCLFREGFDHVGSFDGRIWVVLCRLWAEFRELLDGIFRY
jgi:hypothetical protein